MRRKRFSTWHATKSCCMRELEVNGYMASGSAQENLLVVVVDVSYAFVQSSSTDDSSQRVNFINKAHTRFLMCESCLPLCLSSSCLCPSVWMMS